MIKAHAPARGGVIVLFPKVCEVWKFTLTMGKAHLLELIRRVRPHISIGCEHYGGYLRLRFIITKVRDCTCNGIVVLFSKIP